MFSEMCASWTTKFGLMTPSLQLYSWKCFSVSLRKIISGPQGTGKLAQSVYHTSMELANTSREPHGPPALNMVYYKILYLPQSTFLQSSFSAEAEDQRMPLTES